MQTQNKHYYQITLGKRYQISALRQAGHSLRIIGEIVGIHYSAVSRELRRNTDNGSYEPDTAQQLCTKRKSTAFKASKRNEKTDKIIADALINGIMPAGLSLRMEIECEPHEQLSHTSIYRRIEENKAQGGMLYRMLPRFGKRRCKGGKRNKKAGVKLIPNRVDISERPSIVDDRARIGDWEGDTVYGQDAYLVTLVDRKSRFTLVKRVFSKTKDEVAEAMIALLGKVQSVLTITLDNGGEFAGHEIVSKATGASIFFAKPHASYQRGTNENTNGLLRRFWPKKFKMGCLTEQEIAQRVFMLNFTPRKVLGGLTPFEVFTGQSVALIA